MPIKNAAEHGLLDNGRNDAGQHEHLEILEPIAMSEFLDDGMARQIRRTEIVAGRDVGVQAILQNNQEKRDGNAEDEQGKCHDAAGHSYPRFYGWTPAQS